jgi:hypothetical protein
LSRLRNNAINIMIMRSGPNSRAPTPIMTFFTVNSALGEVRRGPLETMLVAPDCVGDFGLLVDALIVFHRTK